MGLKYLWDTNTAIYFLQKQFPLNAEKFIDRLLTESQPVISAITEIELLCWKSATAADKEVLSNFISDCAVIELEKPIKLMAANIRTYHRLKLPDAIIAATAVVYNYTLITRNVSDFKGVSGLLVVNPWLAE